MLFDAHTHLYDSAASPGAIYQLAVASTPEECALLDRLRENDPLLFRACGVHPWNSGRIPMDALLPWMESYPVIGEIGMDSVWCDIDPELQRKSFTRQLNWASRHGKPVVLHTKGCEKEIADKIAGYPHPILVHWYSCEDHLRQYLDLGCYFTVGPDLPNNPAVKQVAAQAPLNRLMVESDGTGGISWALGREVASGEIPVLLEALVGQIAAIRNCDPGDVRKAAVDNALRFVSYCGSDALPCAKNV